MAVQWVTVGAPPATTLSGPQPMLGGGAGEAMVAELHGKYYTQSYRGNAFIGVSANAGVIPPIYTTTAQVFGIWNKAGNTRNAVLQTLDWIPLVAGAAVIGGLTLSQSLSAGAGIATGGISVFTAATPQQGNIGVSGGNTVSFTASAATTLAATLLMNLNYGFYSTAVTAANATGCHYDFEGGVIVPPNVAVWVTSAPAAQTATFELTLRWEEAPL